MIIDQSFYIHLLIDFLKFKNAIIKWSFMVIIQLMYCCTVNRSLSIVL